MGSPIFKAVSDARQLVAKDLGNVSARLQSTIDELTATQSKTDELKKKLALFDDWMLANPDV